MLTSLKKQQENNRQFMNKPELISVISQLSGKQVFITGATGFLGKAIVEKLLREVPNIKKIYLLARGQKNQSAEARCMQGVFGSSLFDVLRSKHGNRFESFIKSKISVVEGELTAPLFGLKGDAFSQIASQLDLVINSAASVNFREAMDQALQINALSLNNIIALANQGSKNTTPVVQVSTCYVNGLNKGLMLEEVAASASGLIKKKENGLFDVATVITSIQKKIDALQVRFQNPTGKGLTSQDHAKFKEALIQLGIKESRHYGWNDTYTFTKWLGEQLLLQGLDQKNLTILRPSIIESTISSPVAGWVEGIKVADALIYAYAKGRVNIFPGNDKGILDVIPVDLVANAVLLSAAERLSAGSEYHIYQCCSGSSNPITLKDFVGHISVASNEQWKDLPKLFANKPNDNFKTVSTQKFAVYMFLLTAFTWFKTITGRVLGSNSARVLLTKVKTTANLAVIFGFYSAAKYQFDSRKLQGLQARFTAEDQQVFNTNANCFQWQDYLSNVHLPGLHKYAMADKKSLVNKVQVKQAPENQLKQARKKQA
jgi:fatty acyl-CoA reductase